MPVIKIKYGAIFLIVTLFGIVYFSYLHSSDSHVITGDNLSDSKLTQFQSVSTDKINSDGQYIPFYGYTIISMATGQYNYSLLEQFIRESKILNRHLAPLPATSYHVTIFDIFTQRDVPAKYVPVSGSVPSKHWTDALGHLLNDLTAARKICFKLTNKLIFHKTKLNVGKSGLSVWGHLNSEDIISDLRSQFHSIFPESARKTLHYHLSLGYCYKKIEDKERKSIEDELKKLWVLINDEYPLQAPDVYYFETMTKYTPISDLQMQETLLKV